MWGVSPSYKMFGGVGFFTQRHPLTAHLRFSIGSPKTPYLYANNLFSQLHPLTYIIGIDKKE